MASENQALIIKCETKVRCEAKVGTKKSGAKWEAILFCLEVNSNSRLVLMVVNLIDLYPDLPRPG